MGFPVTYYCPRCETLVEVERDGYLADKAVTPYPFEGWTYADPTEPFEDRETVDGVRFVCGESAGVRWRPDGDGPSGSAPDAPTSNTTDDDDGTGPAGDAAVGCGDPFYLSFVRFVDGREVDPRPEAEVVTIDPDPRASGPRGPRGPGGPNGPNGPGGTDGR